MEKFGLIVKLFEKATAGSTGENDNSAWMALVTKDDLTNVCNRL